ncbi:MAG: hypothetical protein BZY88_20320 [SAR202 cluster bacterium Io17-Chloro-G9]|nr:MAG: hypothetical protein BZY88_20320 [SAR202 cluster bacterium Io17-Chloro-G9]
MFKQLMLLRPFMKVLHPNEVDCIDTRKLSSDYLEEGLPPKKASAVQTHLSNCGPCRAFVDTLASTIGVLRRFPGATPPASFKQSVMDKIRREG